jgi:hypothetical protein
MRTGSHRNAFFKGKHRAEYAWFSLAGNMPFTSTSARNAARQIVEATRRGDAELHITLQAATMSRLKGLLPNLAQDVVGVVGRVMPGSADKSAKRGAESESPLTSSFVNTLGKKAAAEYNQEVHSGRRNGG